MKTNKKWETLVSIIVWLVIIWIVIGSIITIINSSYNVQSQYISNSKLELLKRSTENIVKNLDLSNLNIWDEFYLYKNPETKRYYLFTWATNVKYKYIDENWELISNTWSNSNKYMYSRYVIIQKNDSYLWKNNKLVKIVVEDLNNN